MKLLYNEYREVLLCRPDPLRRIFIVLDGNPLIELNGYNILGENRLTLHEIMIHEISHSAARTLDYFYTPIRYSNTLQKNIGVLHRDFYVTLNSGELATNKDFRSFVERLYRYNYLPGKVNENSVLRMIQRDPMMRANMIMENADSFVLFVVELEKMNIGQRAKRYSKAIFGDLINCY